MKNKLGSFLACTALVILSGGCAPETAEEIATKENIIVREEIVEIPGLTEEFELIFMADNHISLCDERDASLQEKAYSRYESFRSKDGDGAEESFQALMKYTKAEQPELLILGGDVVDSAMWESIDFVKRELEEAGVPWIYEMGNHDFEYGEEYYTETAYAEYLPRFADISESTQGYQIKEYKEFMVFAVDDDCNRITEKALESFKAVIRHGKPIVLITHVPIEPHGDAAMDTMPKGEESKGLWEESNRVWGAAESGNSRVLLGENSCVPNETTAEFLALVVDEDSPVELVLAGHIHFYHRDYLSGELVQVVTGAGFEKELVKVTLVPGA